MTCGDWDGFSCAPGSVESTWEERTARAKFARIDEEVRTVCPEADISGQVYSGNVVDVTRAVDLALSRADDLGQRLAELRASRPTPQWEVATYAREGSLYDCIWSSLNATRPALFTLKQAMMVANLLIQSQKYAAAGQATAAQSLQIAIADVKQTVAIKWASKRKDYLAVLEPRMVRSYVSATLLARRHALEGFDFTRAHERLPFVASALGDEVMSRLLADVPDPTDPEPDPTKRRRIAYVPGVFGVR